MAVIALASASGSPGVTTTALGRSGTSRMVVRTQNAVITVDFDGATYPLDHDGVAVQRKGVPLDESVTREAAQAVARDVTTALSSCRTCVRRRGPSAT